MMILDYRLLVKQSNTHPPYKCAAPTTASAFSTVPNLGSKHAITNLVY